ATMRVRWSIVIIVLSVASRGASGAHGVSGGRGRGASTRRNYDRERRARKGPPGSRTPQAATFPLRRDPVASFAPAPPRPCPSLVGVYRLSPMSQAAAGAATCLVARPA